MDDRQHERAAVDHHGLAAVAGAHEGDFLRRAVVEPVQQVDDDRDADDRDDEPENDGADQSVTHVLPPTQRPPMTLMARVCSVIATSVGRSAAPRVGNACVSKCSYRWSPYH